MKAWIDQPREEAFLFNPPFCGGDPRLRIALCGYQGEHEMPAEWSVFELTPYGGMGNQSNGRGRANKARERIWFSPGCLDRDGDGLFSAEKQEATA